jgi:hypothetical protein
MESINFPLSNIQLELLKLFSSDIKENDIKEIKRLIVKYLSNKLSNEADKVWEDNNWTNEDMDKFLKTHMRTPYKGSK